MHEKLSGAEEAEYWRLQEAVTRIENAIYFAGGSDSHATAMLRQFVQNAKQRIATIETEGQHKAEVEKEASARENVAVVMAEREKALSEPERQEYAGFLSEKCFTRSDFGRLEHFYSHSWDKLTDEGKGQMSHRVWEGIRQGEYRFSELPDPVKEKEAQQVQFGLQNSEKSRSDLSAIDDTDRADFLRARKSGDRQESYIILDRPSFTANVATGTSRHIVSQSTLVEPPLVLKGATEMPGQPALVPVAARATGSKMIELPELRDVADPAATLLPPLTGADGSSIAKVRGQ